MTSRQSVAGAIKALEDDMGVVTPARVVDAARDKASVLHEYFEWDDAAAAESHRLDQARALIRSVRVEVRTGEVSFKSVAYIKDPETRDQGYKSIAILSQNETAAKDAVDAEFEAVAGHLRRARDIARALGYADHIEDLLRGVIETRHEIRSMAAREHHEDRAPA